MTKFGKAENTRQSSFWFWIIRFSQIQSRVEEGAKMWRFEESSVFEAWKSG
jgi:hypothetical protein